MGRTSDPSTKDVDKIKNEDLKKSRNSKGNKNLIIKINHINKSDKKHNNKNNNKRHSKKANIIFDINSQQQILGDILIHVSSWNQLIAKNDQNQLKQNKDKKILGVGWKTVY